MRQQTLADTGFEKYQKQPRKDQFLTEMDCIIPWQGLTAAIEPYYPKPEGAGRHQVGIEWMLRMHFLQHWFTLSDPSAEEALYATMIAAPSSTKNQDKVRDQEMHQTKKCNQWNFGMKAHIGVESKTKLIHSIATTAVNVYDSQIMEDLLHGEETRVWSDSAYTGQQAVIKETAVFQLCLDQSGALEKETHAHSVGSVCLKNRMKTQNGFSN